MATSVVTLFITYFDGIQNFLNTTKKSKKIKVPFTFFNPSTQFKKHTNFYLIIYAARTTHG
ncbi:hypothetical protein CMK12_17250 [Candidatus Poribacteria bacterium]|nr:hypothetical protein [Candidatus Poribacteria bacterium]